MNAGAEGAVVVGELLKTDDPQIGHNAATAEYCNMIEAGIIDPTKVRACVCVHVCVLTGSCIYLSRSAYTPPSLCFQVS